MTYSYLSHSGDGDVTEQHEPLLSESQDDSMTLHGQPDSIMTIGDKTDSVINVNDDLDESITPLLGDDDDENNRKEVMLMIQLSITLISESLS